MSTYTATVLECNGVRCWRELKVRWSQGLDPLLDLAHFNGWETGRSHRGDIVAYCPECLASEARRTGETRKTA